MKCVFVRTFVTVQLVAGPPPSQQRPPCLAAVLRRPHRIQPKEALASIERKLDVWCISLPPLISRSPFFLSRSLFLSLFLLVSRLSNYVPHRLFSQIHLSQSQLSSKYSVFASLLCLVPLSSHIRSTEVSFSSYRISVETFQTERSLPHCVRASCENCNPGALLRQQYTAITAVHHLPSQQMRTHKRA